MPIEEWSPSPNFSSREGRKIIAIVHHCRIFPWLFIVDAEPSVTSKRALSCYKIWSHYSNGQGGRQGLARWGG